MVDDVEAAKTQLREAGVELGDVQESLTGRFVFFNDPDGNGWAVAGGYSNPRLRGVARQSKSRALVAVVDGPEIRHYVRSGSSDPVVVEV